MSLDKKDLKLLLDEIDNLFDILPTKLSDEQKMQLKNVLIGPIIEEIESTILNSRAPKMMMIGRSGHGKSSTINAIANKNISEISDVKPGQAKSIPLYIEFPEFGSSWEFIDTRGYFDPTKPEDAEFESAEEQLINDILKHKPDVFMHVINIKEVRTLYNDIETFKNIKKSIAKKGLIIPAFIILSHVDIIGKKNEWPILDHPNKAAQVLEAMRYLCDDILKIDKYEYLDLNSQIKGFSIDDETYLGIIPICSSDDDYWNIDTLRRTIGYSLPKDAKFNFFQATRDKELLRKLSSDIIKRFSMIAGGIGAVPIPIADLILLTPLQLLLIAIIATLSGRKIEKDNLGPVKEFLVAAGLNLGAGLGIRELARQMVKFIPAVGSVVSGGIASAGTYAIGKSAETYFFSGTIVQPKDIKVDDSFE